VTIHLSSFQILSWRAGAMPKRVLVVDNDFFFVEFLAELLESRNYQVTKAYHGAEAISKLADEKFDLFFVDLIMPGISGKQFIQFFRSEPTDPPCIIVALTIAEQMDGLHDVEADYFVAKESVAKMTEHIKNLLGRIEKGATEDYGERSFRSKNLIPRLTTDELIGMLNFQEAITEQMGVGMLIVDRRFRITKFNPAALKILGKPYKAILNARIGSIFPSEAAGIISTFKGLLHEAESRIVSRLIRVKTNEVIMISSLLTLYNETPGWIILLIPSQWHSMLQA
jgi:CheY-like chemotaxis protein